VGSKTGFLIPTNDPYTAASRIVQISNNEELNTTIGHQAKEIALKRHDTKTIVDELLNTYRAVGEDCKGSSTI
jgi:glycosyltransferase involved in cell wall biosynthesis